MRDELGIAMQRLHSNSTQKSIESDALEKSSNFTNSIWPVISALWQELLGVTHVSHKDNFFSLGGHSILAMDMLARLNASLKIEIPIGTLFEIPTAGDFAVAVQSLMTENTNIYSDLVPSTNASENIPASSAQQRLWFISQLGEMAGAYNILLTLQFDGELDVDVLTRTLNRIVERHEILRTQLVPVGGSLQQKILPMDVGLPLKIVDLMQNTNQAEIQNCILEQQLGKELKLDRDRLIQATLIQLAADRNVLSVLMHHSISDGWSKNVFIRELSTLYEAYLVGKDDPQPPLPVQYADYALWQRNFASKDQAARQLEYWATALRNAPALHQLPTDMPRPPQQRSDAGFVSFELDEARSKMLSDLSGKFNQSMFTTLLCGFAVLMSRLSHMDEIMIGIPSANRTAACMRELVGLFVNSLAIRICVADDETIADLFAHVREKLAEAQSNCELPFEHIVASINPNRSLSFTPLFQTSFSWDPDPIESIALANLKVSRLPNPKRFTEFDLVLELAFVDGRVCGGIKYAKSLFARRTVERFAHFLRNVYQTIVSAPDQSIGSISLFGPPRARQAQIKQMAAL